MASSLIVPLFRGAHRCGLAGIERRHHDAAFTPLDQTTLASLAPIFEHTQEALARVEAMVRSMCAARALGLLHENAILVVDRKSRRIMRTDWASGEPARWASTGWERETVAAAVEQVLATAVADRVALTPLRSRNLLIRSIAPLSYGESAEASRYAAVLVSRVDETATGRRSSRPARRRSPASSSRDTAT